MTDTSESLLTSEVLTDQYPSYHGQVEHIHTQPAKPAETVPATTILPDALATPLDHDLYTHQATALDTLQDGANVCVTTSTSSGKTLIYALQIAHHYRENPDTTALIVYPTKALSRDQQEALTALYDQLGLDIDVAVYDGDTPRSDRQPIRENADVIITNFAGVNAYLPHHEKWTEFYSNLEVMAIDESHSYTGILGMHVAWIIRRLQRVFDQYRADPQYILTSATIGNPAEHSQSLIGDEVHVVETDGSPRGEREIVFWNPPVWSASDADDSAPDAEQETDAERAGNERKPASIASSEVLGHLTANDIQTLLFTRSRKLTELTAHRAHEHVADRQTPYTTEIEIEPYHAGHGKETRRTTETAFKAGDIDGVVSTSALELGIDIGGVDSTVVTGYPGTRQSFWQQIGRSGRNATNALSVFIGDYDSIDQYLMSHPEFLLDDAVEDAVVDLTNNEVYAQHILCAAAEIVLTTDDMAYFGEERLEDVVKMWKQAGELAGTLESGVYYTGTGRPQMDISLYASSSDTQFEVRLHPQAEKDSIDMEPIDRDRAYRDFHKGAIYMHKGERYEVTEFVDREYNSYVELAPAYDVDYYTQSKSETQIRDVDAVEHRSIGDFTLYWGHGTVTMHYQFYDKLDIESSQPREQMIPTGLPPLEMQTQMLWLELPAYLEQALITKYADYSVPGEEDNPYMGYMGGLHAVEHGMIGVAPLELMMEKQDLGGLSTFGHPAFDTSGFFIYDGMSGGLGFSRTIYDQFEQVAARTRELIRSCDCVRERGCPACVMDENCGNNNRPLHKSAACDILDHLLTDATQTDLEPYLPDTEDVHIASRPAVSFS